MAKSENEKEFVWIYMITIQSEHHVQANGFRVVMGNEQHARRIMRAQLVNEVVKWERKKNNEPIKFSNYTVRGKFTMEEWFIAQERVKNAV